jgi:tetratricopeptide (TPR) repeat protein
MLEDSDLLKGSCMSRLIILLVVLYLAFELYRYIKRLNHRSRFRPHSVPDELIAKADKAFLSGKFHDARTYLQRAQALDAQSAEICNKLGVVHERLGEYGEALEQFKKALQSDGENEHTHLAVADLLSRMQRFEDAKVHYARAVEIDGGSDTAYFSFARMLESAGETEGACEKYRKTLQLNPSHAEAQAALARCGG